MNDRKHFKWLMLMFVTLFISLAVNAQTLTVNGTVKDALGDPVIGANVLEKGTTNGVITDLDGHFKLSVKTGSTIVVSYIGYVSQEKIAAAQMEFILKDDTETLDEVIVVGYGVQKKSNVTGAIASVKADALENRSNENVGSALQGKLAGVQIISNSGAPGASSTFRIRGYSSTNTSPDPLFLVDGLKVSSIDYLDPESVESIEVLKDAASAAIYGAQAGNGVVIITTKKGSSGNARITYSNMFTWSSPSHSMKMMNASQFKEYWTESGQLDPSVFQNADTDWQDVMFETGFQQKHTLGVQGGNDKGSYYVEATYLTNNGIVTGKYDTNERVTGQVNADYKIKPWLKIGTTSSVERGYMHTVSDNNFSGTGSVIGGAYYFDPTVPVYYQNDSDAPAALGLLDAEAKGYSVMRNSEGKLYGQSVAMQSNLWNPLLMWNTTTSFSGTPLTEHWRTNVNGTFYAELTPFKGFVFTSRLGYRLSSTYEKGYQPKFYMNTAQVQANPQLRTLSTNTAYYQFENFANYNVTLAQVHDLSLMAGMEFAKNRREYVGATVNGLTNTAENFRYLNYFDPNATVRTPAGSDYYRSNMSFFGRVGYTYDNRYMLQFNMRADAYDLSKLSKSNRWGYFPSLSVGWTVSNEKFMESIINKNFLSHLKFRASYGLNGNINSLMLQEFAWSTSMNLEGLYNLNNTGLITAANPSDVLANPDLSWEKSKQYDLGIDARFFNDRLSLSADYYHKTTTDMLVSIEAPAVSGTSSQWVNRGKIRNSGLEFELSWKDKIGKDFQYGITANFSTVDNMVIESPLGTGRTAGGYNFFLPITYLEEGYPMWYIRTYKHKEVDSSTGLPIYYTADELGTDDGKDYAGSGIPDFTYGLTFNASYKNLDLTVFGTGVHGNQLFLTVYRPDLPVANLPEFIFTERWTTTNSQNARFPKANSSDGTIMGHYSQSDFWVFDASYFKIKQIQLGYTFRPALVKKIGLQNLRVYGSIENPFVFTDYKGNDPESMSGTYGGSMSIDHVNYPSTRNVIFGLNVAF